VNVKALFVVVAVFAALVIVCMVAGVARGTSAPGDLSPGWLGVFERDERLTHEEIRTAQPAGCRQQFANGLITLTAGSECQLAVRPSDSFLPKSRKTRLRLAVGQRAQVTVRQPDFITINQELQTNDQKSYSIFRDGGSLVIRCVQPGATGTCVIQVT
jgi:hypothetical protein